MLQKLFSVLTRMVTDTANLQNLEMMTCDKMLYVLLFHFFEKFDNVLDIRIQGLTLNQYLTQAKAIVACEYHNTPHFQPEPE